uniref:Aspartyl beta-hydroxylase/Triadin domain-containing protein n=1 Tax=Gasterosteus aculeatus TaxID=69293 RepID=G3N4B2_GASAC
SSEGKTAVESKNGKSSAGTKYSMFTWFVVLALLGVWSSVAVVYFEVVDYDSVMARAKQFRMNFSEVLQGKLTAYDTDGDGDFDVEDAKVLLGGSLGINAKERERLEKERVAKERERLEKERVARETERLEKERVGLEKERVARETERLEKERVARETERLEKERERSRVAQEKQRAEKDRFERERVSREQKESEAAREKDGLLQGRTERPRLAREKAARDKMEA